MKTKQMFRSPTFLPSLAMSGRRPLRVVAGVLLCLLTACAPPPVRDVPSANTGLADGGAWWQQLRLPQLDQLLTQAWQQGPDARVLAARLQAAGSPPEVATREWQALRFLLAREVVAAYTEWQYAHARQIWLNQRLAVQQEQQQLVARRIAAGLLPGRARYPYQQAVWQTEADSQRAEAEIARQRHRLALLTGQPPHALNHSTPPPFTALPPVHESALAMTATDWLQRRPDLALPRLAPVAGGGEQPAAQRQAAAEEARAALLAGQQVADARAEYRAALAQWQQQQQIRQSAQQQRQAAARRAAAGLENGIAHLAAEEAALQQEAAWLKAQADLQHSWNRWQAASGGGLPPR